MCSGVRVPGQTRLCPLAGHGGTTNMPLCTRMQGVGGDEETACEHDWSYVNHRQRRHEQSPKRQLSAALWGCQVT